MTETKKSFHESFQGTEKVSNLEGGKFPGPNMETISQNPQEIRVTGVSRGGNRSEKFPGVETNSFHLVSKKVSRCQACQAVVNLRWHHCLSCGQKCPTHSNNKEGGPPPIQASAEKALSQEPQPNNVISAPIVNAEDIEERAAIIQYDGEIPKEWAEGLARLRVMPCPEGVNETRWRQAVDNAGLFADQWAANANSLGWDTHDIYGVDRNKPEATIHMADSCT
jgi:hypothetical protein